VELIHTPYLEVSEAAALEREEARASAAASGGGAKGPWMPISAQRGEFGYRAPLTGGDASAHFRGGLRELSVANAAASAAASQAEAEAWMRKLVVDPQQVKWRGHVGAHAAPGTIDKYKPLLVGAPATRALRAMHATKLHNGRTVALQEDALAVDTVHRDAAPGQPVPGAHISTEPLPPPQGAGGVARVGGSASYGALPPPTAAGTASDGTLNTAQGGYGNGTIRRAAQAALQSGGVQLPLGASASAGTVSAGASYSRKGAWTSGILQNAAASTATGLLPRTPKGTGQVPFGGGSISSGLRQGTQYKRPGMPPLSAAERSGPKW
jgi:hypothetical protein